LTTLIIRYYLEIGSIVSRQFVSALAPFAPDEKSKAEMAKLGSDKAYFSETVTKNYLNMAQLLELVGGGKEWKDVPLPIYIEGLHKLRPRYYSISSSSLVQRDKISITVVAESLKFSSRVEAWKGVATNYLLAIKKKQAGEPDSGDVAYDIVGPRKKYDNIRVPLHIRQSSFKLPSDPTKPIIMIGPGLGVAPFRGFCQERAAHAKSGQQVGKTVLFYGCRSRDQDFVYARLSNKSVSQSSVELNLSTD
jgi:NADPH-ferrihemoprotein reductase